jgi:hypothetical protein
MSSCLACDPRLVAAVLAFGIAWQGWPKRAGACEFAPMPNLTTGVLGFEDGAPVLGPAVTLPRNVAFAFWQSHGVPELLEGSEPVELVPLGPEPTPGHSGLVTPSDPLVPGRTYTFGTDTPFAVGDFIDDQAPSPPVIHGADMAVEEDPACGASSCGTFAVVSVALQRGDDDRTPPEHLTYALYLGSSEGRARSAQRPERFGLMVQEADVSFFADDRWIENDVWLSVASVDFAGNESERTEPVQIHAGSSGCHAGGRARLASFGWVLAALAGIALRTRRRAWPRAWRARARATS